MRGSSFFKFLHCCVFVLAALAAKAQPHAAFTTTTTSGCTPLVVSFQDQSTNAVQWKWDLGNSTISFLQNPAATYFLPGNYTIKLIVFNAAGVSDTLIKTNYVIVNSLPQVQFAASNTSGCFPLAVEFTDQSTSIGGSISSWHWDFGDGYSSTSQNPSHIYTTGGIYNVTLIVTNIFGCTKTQTKTNYITVATGVSASFTHTAPTGCTLPQTISFTNTSAGIGPLSFIWNFGDGVTSNATSPTHTYTSNGSFTVSLIVINAQGCRDTAIVPAVVSIGTNQAGFSAPLTGCVGEEINLLNQSSPAPSAANWFFGDGTSFYGISGVKVYTTPGTYAIKLVSQFGACSDSITKSITIFPKPSAGFSASPLIACQPSLLVNFTNSSAGAQSVLWYFGDGSTSADMNPSHNYTTYGNFSVTLVVTNSNGCKDSIVKSNYVVIQKPVISINNLPVNGCAPLLVSFTPTVTSVTPVTSYEWHFGDGSTSTSTNPSHTFAAGIYDVTLIVNTAGGCTDTITYAAGVKASDPPQANFYANPNDVCAFTIVNFISTSTGTVTSWLWDFGDGGTSTDSMPGHMYSDTGYFNITLIVGSNGCYDTLLIADYVHIKPPIANFTVDLDCINKYRKTFTDLSIGADQYFWNFGDGGTTSVPSPIHTYTAPGIYTVSLRVVNDETGCDYTKNISVTVADEQAIYTADRSSVCKGNTVNFTATSNQALPLIANYEWEFGDGTSGAGATVPHIYNVAGTYDVQLIITDVNGCKDTLIKQAYIHVFGPTSTFTTGTPGTCVNSAILFTDQSTTDGTHAITNWSWNYGDGTIDANATAPFIHQYNGEGQFDVTLLITDSYGCRDSVTLPNLITISVPKAIFSSANLATCPAAAVEFINSSTGPGLTYHWSFGDGGTSAVENPTHSYSTDGVYSITLIVRDVYGCADTISKPNYITITTPRASFTLSDSISTCPPLIVQFTNSAEHYESLVWDFGDGNTSLAANPSHIYNQTGTFIAKQTVTSIGGCVSVKTATIKVTGPQGSFTYTPLSGCSPLTIQLTATTQARSSFIWDFNDGTTVPTSDSIITHTYTLPGIYVPKMILRDLAGCMVPVTGRDTIQVNGVIAAFATDTLIGCDYSLVNFTNHSQSNQLITGYQWQFGDGSTSTDENPSHYYATEGIYYPKLKATTLGGCVDSIIAVAPIKIVRTPRVSITQSGSGCTPLTLSFRGNLLNGDTSTINYTWAFSRGTSATGITPAPQTFTIPGIYSYNLFATNSSGCKDTATGSFEVYALPVVDAGADFYICQNSAKPITATGAASYIWSPSIGLNCSTCPAPMAKPDSARTYYVTGTNLNGCKNRDSITVSVVYPFKMIASLGDTLCIGDRTSLTANGAASFAWSPSAGLSTTTGSTVVASPRTTTLYKVIGQDGKNCFADTAYFPMQVYPIPVVKMGADSTINVGTVLTLHPQVSGDVSQVLWQNPVGMVGSNYPDISVRPTGQTRYTVNVVNEGGCTASAARTIYVRCDGSNVFIPNTFSPNKDGSNDVFYVRGTGLFNVKQMKIFNRWGEEVFSKTSTSANDPAAGWDGSYKGVALNTDVYIYLVEIQCENNTSLLYKGNVTLLK